VDGTYGTYTRNAIECFRRIAGLTVDGTVGTSTWNELNDPSYLHIDYCNTGPYPFCYYYAGYLSGDQLSQASNGPGYWYTMNIADTSWVAMDTGGPA
jgi:hypothetical protein